jgi:hypothetical protein
MIEYSYKGGKYMRVDKWFNKQSKLVQIILLIIPFVGWLVEIGVRLSLALRKQTLNHILVFVLFLLFGWIIQFVDLFYVLLKGRLILTK